MGSSNMSGRNKSAGLNERYWSRSESSSRRSLALRKESQKKSQMISYLGWTLIGAAVWFAFLVLISLADGLLLDFALIFTLIVIIAGICAKMTEGTRRQEHQVLTSFWSEVARETGLTLECGCAPRLFRLTREPGVSGIYRGYLIFASSITCGSAYENFKQYTYISLEMQNANGCQLLVRSRSFLERIIRFNNTSNEHKSFDQHIHIEGYPVSFLRKALQRIVRSPGYLTRPNAVTPLILLQGSELYYQETGVPVIVEDQISILNLLCDLADLAEGRH